MKHIAVIPARSGSKGLKDKNIRELNGKPLLAYSIEAARQSGVFDCIHVSTDSEKYARLAREYGADVPFLRDPALAGDTADTWDALRYVLQKYAAAGEEYDTVTLLQPTSPLRDASDVRGAFAVLEAKQADSVISVCRAEHSPLLCNTLHADGSMQGFLDTGKVGRRQDCAPYYQLNGAIYIQKTQLLMEKKNLYGEKSYAYVMSAEHSVDIDTELDFIVAQAVMAVLQVK